MSVKAMTIIWEVDLPRPEKFVLLALADHADHEGGNIAPSLGRIAWKTGYSYQKVTSIVKQLREDHILELTGGTRNRVNVYRICFEALVPLAPFEGKNYLGGKENRPLEQVVKKLDHPDGQVVKKVDHPDGKETRPLEPMVKKIDHLSGKESRPLDAQVVKKVDHLAPNDRSSGKETLYKPLSLKLEDIITDISDTTTITDYLSAALEKIGINAGLRKRLIENYDADLILQWLRLYVRAYELGIARGAGWLVSALDQSWSLELLQQRINDEIQKQKNKPGVSALPAEVLSQISSLGWMGGLEELEQYHVKAPQDFSRWLNYTLETPNDGHRAGRFLEGLRSGIAAPPTRAERNSQFLQGFSIPDIDQNMPYDDVPSEVEPTVPEDTQNSWRACLRAFDSRTRQIHCEVAKVEIIADILCLSVRSHDPHSYVLLSNIIGYEYFQDNLLMFFHRPVQVSLEEYVHD